MPIDPDTLPDDPLRRLQAIMAVLRGPRGCPWDREQDHRSLRSHLLEETYEVLSQLDRSPPDDEALVEELGDLLLQVVFHAQIASEQDRFDLDGIAAVVSEKLVRRHPHVFADVEVDGSADVLRNWEALKRQEGKASALEGVPPTLPALLRASRVLSRAEQAGFRWPSASDARSKVQEELGELLDAEGDVGRARHELGDVLLALVTYAHHLDLEPESALREALERFDDRFARLEERLYAAGTSLSETNPERLAAPWLQTAGEGDQPAP